MKAKRRKFIEVDDILLFNKANNYEIELYFDSTKFCLDDNDTLYLWFDHSFNKTPISIFVEAVYFDTSKKVGTKDTIEFIEKMEILVPKEGILKHNEFSVSINTIEGPKVLWKLNFTIKPRIDANIHISLL